MWYCLGGRWFTMDKELIAQLRAAAERNAKRLSELEHDPEFLEKQEAFCRQISKVDPHKVFDIWEKNKLRWKHFSN